MSTTSSGFGVKSQNYGLYINGQWLDVEETIEVRHKYTNEVIGTIGKATVEHVDAAVAAARAALSKPLKPIRRAEILQRAAELLRERADEFALTIAREAGKPLKDAKTEVNRGIQTLTLSAEEAKRLTGESIPLDPDPVAENRIGVIIRVPVGVVAAIAPFNFPLNLVLHKVGPALAGGNAVVLKPATTTPLTAAMLCNLLQEAGLPAGYLNLVVGSGSTVGAWLTKHPGIDMITFTGSPEVGRWIKENSGLNKVTLELGNNSANIVHHDADLDRAAELLARRAFGSAGQFCISVQRIYVHRDVYEEFAAKIVAVTERLQVGNPEDPDTDVGPLITEQEASRVEQWINEAVAAGARCLTGGGQRDGSVVLPTLLADVTADMKVVCEEVFGPVASLVPYDTFDEAIEYVNTSNYGLQAGVFTRDLNLAWEAARRIECAGVIINDTSSYRADMMPYGGVKQSGIGREGPRYALEEMTERRIIVFAV